MVAVNRSDILELYRVRLDATVVAVQKSNYKMPVLVVCDSSGISQDGHIPVVCTNIDEMTHLQPVNHRNSGVGEETNDTAIYPGKA